VREPDVPHDPRAEINFWIQNVRILYCVIPEEFIGKNVVKFGRTENVKKRFYSYGQLEVLRVFKVQNVIRAERDLHELARVYFGKAVFHKEYYSCDDTALAVDGLTEIT
jgi:hypothetical protein